MSTENGKESLLKKGIELVSKHPYLPVMLAIVFLCLCVTPVLASLGAVLSLSLLYFVIYFENNSDDAKAKFEPLVKVLAAIGLVIGLVVSSGSASHYGANETDFTVAEAAESETEQSSEGRLSLKLEVEGAEDYLGGDQAITIEAKGSEANGKLVNQTITMQPGQNLALGFGAGEYTFNYTPNADADDGLICKSKSYTVDFAGSEDRNVVFDLVADAEATNAALARAQEAEALAQQKAAEEAAEQQRQQEAAAQLKAQQEAERKAAEEASRAQTTSAPIEATVYVAASGNGQRYHSRSSCSNMKGTVSLSVSQAQSQGYTPCKKCY